MSDKKIMIKKYAEVEEAGKEEIAQADDHTKDGQVEESAQTAEAKTEESTEAALDSIQVLENKLDVAQTEAKNNYDRLLRVSAEFENYKKRMTRELEDYRKFANESIFKQLLPVVDNLERAMEAAADSDDARPILEGVRLTHRDILKVFENFQVKPIEALKHPFDPSLHQAVMQEPSDEVDDNTVVKELQKGYMIHDRLLRPSMVVVSTAKAKATGDEEQVQEASK